MSQTVVLLSLSQLPSREPKVLTRLQKLDGAERPNSSSSSSNILFSRLGEYDFFGFNVKN